MADASPDPRKLAAILDWYVENGVDLALDDAPHDRYADSAREPVAPPTLVAPPPREAVLAPRAERPQPAPAPGRTSALPVAPDEAARAATLAAAQATDLDDLAMRLAGFEHAPFRDMARHFLFAAGVAHAPLLVFDVAPGEAEEASGEAFCGQQARLLDNMLAAIGYDRTRARLAYFSPWRPPGLTNLTPQQIAIFAPFARRHVELARPEIVLLFGEAAARAFVPGADSLNKMRGRLFDIDCGAHQARAYVFQSLDTILRSATFKPGVWRDLRAASALLTP